MTNKSDLAVTPEQLTAQGQSDPNSMMRALGLGNFGAQSIRLPSNTPKQMAMEALSNLRVSPDGEKWYKPDAVWVERRGKLHKIWDKDEDWT